MENCRFDFRTIIFKWTTGLKTSHLPNSTYNSPTKIPRTWCSSTTYSTATIVLSVAKAIIGKRKTVTKRKTVYNENH